MLSSNLLIKVDINCCTLRPFRITFAYWHAESYNDTKHINYTALHLNKHTEIITETLTSYFGTKTRGLTYLVQVVRLRCVQRIYVVFYLEVSLHLSHIRSSKTGTRGDAVATFAIVSSIFEYMQPSGANHARIELSWSV